MISLSIVIPTFNEEESIRGCIARVEAYMHEHHVEYELIIADDGSTDGTMKIMKELCVNNPLIILIQNTTHQYGIALRRAISACTKDYILFFPADLRYSISDLESFLKEVPSHDYILGYREKVAEPFFKIILLSIASIFPRLVLGWSIRDVFCDFMLFKREILSNLPLHVTSIGIYTEILADLRKKGLAYIQMPVIHYANTSRKSKGITLEEYLEMIGDIIKLKLHLFT